VLVSGYVAGQLSSISAGWHIVLNLGIGTGAVYILRWYWWRINAWSEISAMTVAAAVALYLKFGVTLSGSENTVDAKTALITGGLHHNRMGPATLADASRARGKTRGFSNRRAAPGCLPDGGRLPSWRRN